MPVAMESSRQKADRIRSQLKDDRHSFISQWTDLGNYILPMRPRFIVAEANKGDRKNQKIYDNTATLSARTLRSGLMAGITNPARPWFRMTTEDKDLAEVGSVKKWLHDVTNRIATIFLQSNVYNTLPTVYGDDGTFGTAAMLVEEDFTGKVIRTYAFPVGSYMIGLDESGLVRVFAREFTLTVRQVVEKFAEKGKDGEPLWDNISSSVQESWKQENKERLVDIVHVLAPNPHYNPDRLGAKYKRYMSIYYEQGMSGNTNSGPSDAVDSRKTLRESGFDEFPVLAPRWEVNDGDAYGTSCPGMTCIGDTKQLQWGEKRGAQAIDKMVTPPVNAPTEMRKSGVSMLPGGVNYTSRGATGQKVEPAYQINFRINELEAKQEQIRQRIRRAYFEDLFLMLANSDRRQITATEIAERKEEKLLALGPVLGQMNSDLLDPLIDLTFNFAMRQGELPPPPEELQGRNIKVEYISILAQAQKMSDIGGLERFSGAVIQMAANAQDPTILDKFNTEQWVDEYADRLGVPPTIVRSDEEVQAIKAQRQASQQAAQQAELAQAAAGTAKDLSQAGTEKESLLTEMMDRSNAGNLVQ